MLDANDGFGLAAGAKAIKKGVDVAKKGICIVGVKNSSHPGALASILLPAAEKALALGFTHADSLQLTFGGKEAFFGTNPICFVAPRYNQEPFCLDMATTQISWNKLLNLLKDLKNKLPNNSAADKNGRATNNPNLAESLISIGAYKGYGLAAMIEIMCSVFLGMNFGKNIPPMYKSSMHKPRKLGQFYLIFRSDIFINKNNFLKNLNKMCNQVKKQKKVKMKKFSVPNDKEILICKTKIKKWHSN